MTEDNELDDPQFWQKIALEAVVNDDDAKAYELRIETFFDEQSIRFRPQQKNSGVLTWNNAPKDAYDCIVSFPEFDIESIEEQDHPQDTKTAWKLEGIQYTDWEEYK